jgi:hypothetical protein
LLYGGLIGILVWLCPNIEYSTLERGEQTTIRLGVFSWLRYRWSEERWHEGVSLVVHKEISWHASFINLSVLAGLVGMGLLATYRWQGRRRPEPSDSGIDHF